MSWIVNLATKARNAFGMNGQGQLWEVHKATLGWGLFYRGREVFSKISGDQDGYDDWNFLAARWHDTEEDAWDALPEAMILMRKGKPFTMSDHTRKEREFNAILEEGKRLRHVSTGMIGVCRMSEDTDEEPGDWYIDYGDQPKPKDSVWIRGCYDRFVEVGE
jgi:hypothetical protein